jgi:hypothetical protein
MSVYRLLLLGMLAVPALSCSTSLKFASTGQAAHPMVPRSVDQVKVYTTPPELPYVEVGIIEARQSSTFSPAEMQEIIDDMRTYGAKLGCDGILMLGSNDLFAVAGTQYSTTSVTLKGYRATCLAFQAPSPALASSSSVAATLCVPNSTQRCYGPAGCQGGQSCLANGSGYDVCDCGNSATSKAAKAPKAARPASR